MDIAILIGTIQGIYIAKEKKKERRNVLSSF